MSIAASPISALPISSLQSGSKVIKVGCVFSYGNGFFISNHKQSYTSLVESVSVQPYTNGSFSASNDQFYGIKIVSKGFSQSLGDCVIVRSKNNQPYESRWILKEFKSEYSNGPFSVSHSQPYSAIFSASCSFPWNLQSEIKTSCDFSWSFITPFLAQATFKYDLAERNHVTASFKQIYNLNSDRAVIKAGSVVRAFHLGTLI
ncbi:MAG: hypothetical protein HQL75_00215 [Magnetococcales bacterium]|nr:hypothetical protein [Magnetococcales bacterium]